MAALPAGRPASALQPREAVTGGWTRFWFTAVDPIGLHAVRMFAGLLFLFWLLTLAGHEDGLFGLQGWFDREAYINAARMQAESQQQGMPNPIPVSIGWSALFVVGGDPTLLHLFYWTAVAIVVLFTAGVATRLTGVLTWVAVASFTANPALPYEGDALLLLLSFYLMLGYLGYGLLRRGQSVAALLLGPRDTLLLGGRPGREGPQPSVAANLALRLLQVHFAIVVVVSGLHKLQFGDWWSGTALWYPSYPPLHTTVAQAREHAEHVWTYLGVLGLIAYGMLAWQLTFPLFAWRPRWRVLLLSGAALGWLGTALVYDLPLFGVAYFIGCLAYLSAPEWRWVLSWLPRIPGLQGLERWFPAAQTQVNRAAAMAAGRER